jgi:hypothetical protein
MIHGGRIADNDAGGRQGMETRGLADADLIRQRAYELWQDDGCPEGRDTDYWLKAEAELAAEDSPGPGEPAGSAGADSAAARSEPDITPLDQAGSPRPARKTGPKSGSGRKAASGPATSGGSEPTGSDAAIEAEDRGEYVQQRRTRRKAEG